MTIQYNTTSRSDSSPKSQIPDPRSLITAENTSSSKKNLLSKKTSFAINVQGLRKSFDGKEVVCGVGMQIKEGEIYGFLGPNGSGKTTTLRMICGLMKPDAGTGHCLGYDILTQSDEIKKQVGYMTQRFSLYKDLTIRENLEFVSRLYQLKHTKDAVDKAIDQLGFSASRAKQLAGNLSGGWQQRLALAAAMLHDPKVLLLDEPTAGVDPQARREFWEEIHRLAEKGITSLVTTHYMDEAERCNRLAYLSFGHILTRGTMQEVIEKERLTVWSIRGTHNGQLVSILLQQPSIEQVTPFGNELHIVGHDKAALEKAIAPYQEKYECREINANLEDVFISLASNAKDNFE